MQTLHYCQHVEDEGLKVLRIENHSDSPINVVVSPWSDQRYHNDGHKIVCSVQAAEGIRLPLPSVHHKELEGARILLATPGGNASSPDSFAMLYLPFGATLQIGKNAVPKSANSIRKVLKEWAALTGVSETSI